MNEFKTHSDRARRAALGLAAAVATLLLAACGGSGSGGADGDDGGGSDTAGNGGATTREADDGRTRSYALPGEEVYPEGVAYEASSGDFFVSSTADGTVFRGNVEESGAGEEAEVFLEGGQDRRETAVGLKLDEQGRLFVAGGDSGRVFVYDAGGGDLLGSFQNDREQTFVNDAAVAPSGSVYFTDSFAPVLYRLYESGGRFRFEEWLDLEGTPVEYVEGFNLNGIVATEDGGSLIATHSTTGQLFRIDTDSREVVEIDLGGEAVNGDGLALDGTTLYAVAGDEILPVELSDDYTAGTVGEGFADPTFASPTTIARYDGRLLVVNSQFDAQESGDPSLPFTVSDIPIP